MPNPKDTLSLVESLRSADPPASATTLMLQAADEIERLTSQGGVPEGQFLLERLSEVEFSGCDEEFVRDWLGHVEPAIERFRSALAAAPSPPVQQSRAVTVPGCQWHDISTAPKDGTLVLLYMPGGICIAPSVEHSRPPNEMARQIVRRAGELPDYVKWTPTHWMPLPPAPVNDDRTNSGEAQDGGLNQTSINASPKPEGNRK